MEFVKSLFLEVSFDPLDETNLFCTIETVSHYSRTASKFDAGIIPFATHHALVRRTDYRCDILDAVVDAMPYISLVLAHFNPSYESSFSLLSPML
jgi:hypothetical protein